MLAPSPPTLDPDHALFLDFDGTLVDIAPSPDRIVVDPALTRTLARLLRRQSGALAIVSGRPIGEIDRWLAPLQLPAAGIHGAERRDGHGAIEQRDSASLAPIVGRMERLAAAHPGLRVERKRGAVALHYRDAPQCETLCREALQDALAEAPDLALLPGKCVFEVLPRGISKGRSVQAFLGAPPFAGRQPVFVGDDVTDEAGFEAVQALGGIAVKVGAGASVARFRLDDAAAVRRWLADAAAPLPSPTERMQDATGS